MATIVKFPCGNPSGVSVCDARCYNAEGDHCTCICQGFNHGVGRRLAEQRVKELIKKVFEDLKLEPLTEE
jgi:hypothetical protein